MIADIVEVPQVLSVEEAGKVLGLGRTAAYDAIARGDIPHLRLGRRIVVPMAALRKMLENPQGKHDGDANT